MQREVYLMPFRNRLFECLSRGFAKTFTPLGDIDDDIQIEHHLHLHRSKT